MNGVLTLACLLAVAHQISAQCGSTRVYTEALIPQCASKEVEIKWPNYKDQATYYRCDGIYNPVEVTCPSGQYFAFVLQTCVPCNRYIPPVNCSQLRTQNPPQCVRIGEAGSSDSTNSPRGSPFPTPNYPGESVPSAATSPTVNPTADGTATPEYPNTETPSGQTSQSPSPSPVTDNSNELMSQTSDSTSLSAQDGPPIMESLLRSKLTSA